MLVWQDNGTVKRVGFIVDDYMMDEIEEDDGSDEEVDLFDSVCAICDNGGDLLWYAFSFECFLLNFWAKFFFGCTIVSIVQPR